MAVGLRAAQSAKTESGSSVTVTKPTGTVSGDYMVAMIMQDNDATIANTTGNTGAGFAQIGTTGNKSGSSPSMKVFGHVAGGSEPANYAMTIATGASTVCVLCSLTGVNLTTPLRVTTAYATGATNVDPPAPNTATGPLIGDLVLTMHGGFGAGTISWTAPSGVLTVVPNGQQDTTWISAGSGYRVVTANGVQSGLAMHPSGNVGSGWMAMSIVFAQDSGAGSGPPPGNFLPFMGHHVQERPGELWTPERRLHAPSRRILDLAA